MKSDFLRHAALALLLASACATGAAAQERADLVLVNGRVFTADPLQPWAQAVAIRGDRIVAVGTSEQVSALAGGAARVVDVGGRTVIPGFNDAHWHAGPGTAATYLRFGSRDPSIAEVGDSIAAAAARAPAGSWIAGDVGDAVLGNTAAARARIDRSAPDHPVRLTGWTGHGVVYNRAATELEGIAANAADPAGGWWVRDGDRVIGAFGYAMFDAQLRRVEAVPDSTARAAVMRELGEAAALGLTSMQDMGIPLDGERTMRLLGDDSPLRVRVIRVARPDATRIPRDGATAGLARMSGVKWITDGTPVERNAFLGRPYTDRPGSHGRPYMDYALIRDAARAAHTANVQPMFHAVGDSAIALVIRALREVAPDSAWRRLRPRIEHGDFIRRDQLDDARRLGLIVVQNPAHLMIPDVIGARVGPRMPDSQLLASLRRAGVGLALGSDGPLSPFLNLMFATMHPGNPAEALTMEEAVVAYTYGSAFAEGIDDKGMIAAGMLADLAVLSQDIFTVPAQALPATTSVMTIVGGRVVHEADRAAE